jgi:hypothetical protein
VCAKYELFVFSVLQLTNTGFHATDAESFATAIHDALSLLPSQQLKMRHAARELAENKFSEAEFERGFGRGWERLVHCAEERLGEARLASGDAEGVVSER